MAYKASFQVTGNGGGGPRADFGTDADIDQYMEVGAYGNVNNIDTKNRVLRIFSCSGQVIDVRIVNLPNASTAPAGADLEAVVIDKATGKLYIQ